MKVLAITQARTGSSRLPAKVLKTLNGKSILAIHLERLLHSKEINQLLVATTTDPADEAIVEIAKSYHLPFYKGSVQNVLDRYYQAAKSIQPEWVVRVTSDCPLIDASLVDEVIRKAMELNFDYVSNTLHPTFPNGMDVEVFKFSALEKAWREATLNSDKEHVTPYIHRNSTFNKNDLFKSFNFEGKENYGEVRLTLDEPADLEVISIIVQKLGIDKDWKTYGDFYLSNPDIKSINERIDRNEGYNKSLKDDKT